MSGFLGVLLVKEEIQEPPPPPRQHLQHTVWGMALRQDLVEW